MDGSRLLEMVDEPNVNNITFDESADNEQNVDEITVDEITVDESFTEVPLAYKPIRHELFIENPLIARNAELTPGKYS